MKRVLFVDVRNATRSQIAEAWFTHLTGEPTQASSCGTLPAQRVSINAIQVMSKLGIDLSRKWPKPITQRLLDRADIVVFIGTAIYPRVHSGVRVWDLEDTAERPLEQVRDQCNQICRRVEQLIAEIAKEEAAPAWIDWDVSLPSQLQQVWN
jgi:arsenate reductase (thioredoxin)